MRGGNWPPVPPTLGGVPSGSTWNLGWGAVSVSLYKIRPESLCRAYSWAFLTKNNISNNKKPTENCRRHPNLLSLVGKKHKQSAANGQGLGSRGKRHPSPTPAAGARPQPVAPGSWPGSGDKGIFVSAPNLNQSATNCFFEKRCLLNNFNCHKMTKMGF